MSRQTGGKKKRFAFRRPRPALITDARRSPLENWQHRKRVYAWIQLSRVPFLLAAGASFLWWENWIVSTLLFIISVPLPGIAVVIANGVGEPKDERSKQVYKPQAARQHQARVALEQQRQRALGSGTSEPNDPPPTVIDHD